MLSAPKETADFRPRRDRWQGPLYWLIGARWESLRDHSPAERDRIAILGSAILVAPMMAFVGMLFFTTRRWPETSWPVKVGGSFFWAFVILLVDRIVVATYRPFESIGRRLLQVAARIALAGVVSALIALPFCLDLYSASIQRFYRELFDLQAESLRIKYENERQAILDRDQKAQGDLDARLHQIRENHPESETLEGLVERRIRQWKEDPMGWTPFFDGFRARIS